LGDGRRPRHQPAEEAALPHHPDQAPVGVQQLHRHRDHTAADQSQRNHAYGGVPAILPTQQTCPQQITGAQRSLRCCRAA
jgi:hypothetical protein